MSAFLLATTLTNGAETAPGLGEDHLELPTTMERKTDHRRPVRVRTLKRIPRGTHAVVYRSTKYYPVNGMFYIARSGIYTRVFPPVGFRVRTRSLSARRIVVSGKRYWYAAGIFYQKEGREYRVVRVPLGAVVRKLPEDAEKLIWGGFAAFQLNGAVYRKVKNGYRVVALLDLG